MNRVTHNLRGLDALRARLAALPGLAEAAASDALAESAKSAAQDIRGALRATAGSHPSLPGRAPGDAEGRIADAVEAVRDTDRPAARVRVDLPFAEYLEFGTRKMAARPFLRPVMLEHGRNAGTALAAALRAATASLKGFRR